MTNKTTYTCSVLNCGNGECVHKLLNEKCPLCGQPLVEVTTTGFKFCSDVPRGPYGCEYEKDPA